MRISVIITVYNLEHFVSQAIESVLHQTRKADEIIVVDDGSSDNSVEVIERYNDRVLLVRMNGNSGVLPSFLAGIKRSTGDILAFLDGDDIWMPEKLEKIAQVLENESEVMMVTHLHQWIDEQGKPTGVEDETHRNLNRVVVKSAGNKKMMDGLLKNSILCYKGVWLGSAFCIKRSCIDWGQYEAWVLSLPGRELSHQDQPLAAYLIFANPEKSIVLINEYLFKYRVYKTNSSGASTDVKAALKTISRSIATVNRTREIVKQNSRWKEEYYCQTNKLKELMFYKFLYERQYSSALKNFISLAYKVWGSKKVLKESQRFLGCLVLGPSKFLLIKTKNRFK